MTRERAIEVLDRWSGFGSPDGEYTRVNFEANINDVEEAHDMAIAVLREQEEQSKLVSNADRIRAMSDEELGELLMRYCPHPGRKEACGQGCEKCIAEWLQQPVKEDA